MGYYDRKLAELNLIEEESELLFFLENLKRQKDNGSFHLILAFANDALGNQTVAEWNYRRAKKLGFGEEHLQTWYEGFGSTLRWGYKLDESKEILIEGMALFPESKKMEAYLALTRFRLGEIDKNHLSQIVNDNAPELKAFIEDEMSIELS